MVDILLALSQRQLLKLILPQPIRTQLYQLSFQLRRVTMEALRYPMTNLNPFLLANETRLELPHPSPYKTNHQGISTLSWTRMKQFRRSVGPSCVLIMKSLRVKKLKRRRPSVKRLLKMRRCSKRRLGKGLLKNRPQNLRDKSLNGQSKRNLQSKRRKSRGRWEYRALGNGVIDLPDALLTYGTGALHESR